VTDHATFLGLTTLDLVYLVERPPSANEKIVAERQEVAAGGPAANAAVTFSHLGGRARLVTGVGSSIFARVAKDDLEAHGVEVADLASESGGQPPVASIIVSRPTGHRAVVSVSSRPFRLPGSALGADALGATPLLMVDGHYMELAIVAAQRARAAGARVVLDGGSWKPGTEQLLPFVDAAVCSNDFRPPGCGSAADTIETLAGARFVAVTNGPEPVRYRAGARAGAVDVPEVPVVDSLGAGDVLHGAFCKYLLELDDPVAALRRAVSVAARSCSFFGTRVWMAEDAGHAPPARRARGR
jgi:sugar/nucleoside kinase (ribokinase family)